MDGNTFIICMHFTFGIIAAIGYLFDVVLVKKKLRTIDLINLVLSVIFGLITGMVTIAVFANDVIKLLKRKKEANLWVTI